MTAEPATSEHTDVAGVRALPASSPEVPPPQRGVTVRFAVQRLRRHPGALVVLALTLIGGVGLGLLPPLLIRQYIEQEVARSSLVTSAAVLVAGYLAAALAVQVILVVEAAVAERLARTVMDQVRVDVTRHCLDLGMDFHHATRPGELVERVEGDVNLLANFLSKFLLMVVGQALLLAGLIVALVVVDWRIGTSVAVVSVAAALVIRRLARRGQTAFTEFRRAASGLSGFLGEALTAVPDLHGVGAQRFARRRLLDAIGEVYRAEQSAAIWGNIALWAAASFAAWSGTAVALLWSVHLYFAGAMTIGTVYLVFLYTQQMTLPMDRIAFQIQDYQAASACVRRLQELLDLQPSHPATGSEAFPAGPVHIEFRETSFRYADGLPDVLRQIGIVVPAGQTVGVVGRTGSGKSTLVRLLVGLHAPTGGAILLNGVDVTALDRDRFRERVAVIPQEVQLFKATLRDNVTMFDPSWPDAQVRDAFAKLGMGDWLAQLPDGLETVLGPGGLGLSAGEEQLVSIVRAFLSDPAVVVLDEASSRLDSATERTVKGAVTTLLSGRTGVVVAHRLSTLTEADWILHLDDGRVVEYGRRSDLVRDPRSRFSRLLAQGLNDLDLMPKSEQPC